MATPLYIRIQQPCHQNWNEMTPNQQGAFCKNCRKNVIDFTNKTENEIYEMLSGATGNVCGRFNTYQLNTAIQKTEIQKSFFNLKAIVAGIIAFFAVQRATATDNNKPKATTTQQHKFSQDSATTKPQREVCFIVKKNSPLISIKKQLVDSTGGVILFATVRMDTSLYAITNSLGEFEIIVDKRNLGDSVIIYSVGYKPERIPVSEFLNLEKPIVLAPIPTITVERLEPIIMGGMSIHYQVEPPFKYADPFNMIPDFDLHPRITPRLKGL